MDPYQFRLQNVAPTEPSTPWLDKGRWLDVMKAATDAAKWTSRVAASNLSKAAIVTGRGVSATPHAGSLAAVVAEIEVNKKTGKVVAKQMYIAQDAGLAINPALLENQMIGGTIMATSRALYEEVTFDTSRVTSLDWVSYPIMRFKDHPTLTPIVVNRPDQVSGGAGEVPMPATAAALANAFFDATGVRMRQSPMSPPRVRAVLKAAGVA